MVGLHVLQTGIGAFYVDRWPDPGVILAEAAGNFSLVGDPMALDAQDLQARVSGFIDAPHKFIPILKETFNDLKEWERAAYLMQSKPHLWSPSSAVIRRLAPGDSEQLQEADEEMSWISNTWGNPEAMAASGYAWGAFKDGILGSVACSFFVGEHYEELGVVTAPDYRRLGLSAACTGRLCEDILGRGKQPSWSTSPENRSSISVAEKVGFSFWARARLFVTGVPIPEEY